MESDSPPLTRCREFLPDIVLNSAFTYRHPDRVGTAQDIAIHKPEGFRIQNKASVLTDAVRRIPTKFDVHQNGQDAHQKAQRVKKS